MVAFIKKFIFQPLEVSTSLDDTEKDDAIKLKFISVVGNPKVSIIVLRAHAYIVTANAIHPSLARHGKISPKVNNNRTSNANIQIANIFRDQDNFDKT